MFDISTYISLAQTFGFGVAQTSLVVFLLWKIATNHLKHIADDIKIISKDVKNVANEPNREVKISDGKNTLVILLDIVINSVAIKKLKLTSKAIPISFGRSFINHSHN